MHERNYDAATLATVVIAVLLGCAAFTWLGPVLRPFLVAVFLFYATQSAAKALVRHTDLPAREIAEKALQIAAEICIYTNDKIIVDALDEAERPA